MLLELSVSNFVLLKPAVSVVTTLPAIIASVLAGRALLRRAGTRLAGPSPLGATQVAPTVLAPVATPVFALAG
jgi:uncharacterized protein YybS (DUF2232 family)